MCGLLGYVSLNKNVREKLAVLRQGLCRLSHRGPDSEGEYFDDTVYFGHKRLSIIDVTSAGAQPRKSRCSSAYLIFNGEIYNYKELAVSLNIKTTTDSDVILEGYLREGPNFFSKLRGIYAFSIYVPKSKTLVLARDHAGIKPLYYYSSGSDIAFASEIKALGPILKGKVSVNEDQVWSFLNLAYCTEPQTIYNEVHSLPPGTFRIFNFKSKETISSNIFDRDFSEFNSNSYSINLEKTNSLLIDAVRKNINADVEVAVALSGGVDSSLVYALANKFEPIKGITVKMGDKRYDESEVAKEYASQVGGEHEIVTTDAESKLDLLRRLLAHFDQPYADSSLIPFFILNQQARKHTKVLIGGDGGDEIQGGYGGYSRLPFLHKLQVTKSVCAPALRCLTALSLSDDKKRKLEKVINLISQPNFNQMLFYYHSWFPTSNKYCYGAPFMEHAKFGPSDTFLPTCSEVRSVINENYFRVRMQSDYLRKSDMMSMINSVEFRVPMLDEDLTKFSLSIPYSQKIRRRKGKAILRDIHAQVYSGGHSRSAKTGFRVPCDVWLGEKIVDVIVEEMTSSDSFIFHFVRREYLHLVREAVCNGKYRHKISREAAYQRLLILYSLHLWYLDRI